MGNKNSTNVYKGIEERKYYNVLRICAKTPERLQVRGRVPYYPLHFACMHCAPLFIIEAIINAAPEIAITQDLSRNYPLHYACWNGAHVDVIRLLLETAPSTARAMSATGNTPLMCGCFGRTLSTEAIILVIRAFPGALTVQNCNFRTPIEEVLNMENFPRKQEYLEALIHSPSYYESHASEPINDIPTYNPIKENNLTKYNSLPSEVEFETSYKSEETKHIDECF